ncbi:sugar diacid utilization regulator [Mycolicibacterium mageritense DSM 44476 = CIP 104973]|uniref:CdaR family transcriptional regulator n=1 Tax=Mycolicibacterium mageritense TaxID=53462 RepID=A0ABN5YEM0_MYCME|nr:sugar diacid recognition domain-containing protein [Mycolicibacterium mageritense]MCC9181383.1 helix-turn-helix domain-containing protein [Mycolicibacterium mageritense]BBX36539.1 CdaR family transcriptional regulator [Mycolicibacterium mageritense]CDO24643.1 GAF domain-containing protein [Mycolicibacterium mageritense DSM 44476 = CIP 104973]
MLGQALAQQIAEEITDVIGHNVLITDESGIVVGSGDQSRVGQFHEASVEVIRSRRTIAHSSDDARHLVGTLPGVTVPLIIDDDVVGTVGLSGSPDQVEQFGLVVKRQTEILMQEAARIGTRMTRERAVAELLREVCEWHHSRVPKAQLLRRARTMGYDLTQPRRIVLVHWEESDTGPDEPDPAQMIRDVETVFHAEGDLVAALSRTVIAVATPDDEKSRPVGQRCAELMSDQVATQGFRIAIGSRASGVAELNVSARDAFDALQLGPAVHPDLRVHRIEQVRLHQALSVVPIDSRRRLADGLLGPLLADREWPVLRETLIAWGDSAFNITKAAAALHVHRNTLIYRLDKIARMLGRPLDESGLAVAVYVTCVLDRLGRGPEHR